MFELKSTSYRQILGAGMIGLCILFTTPVGAQTTQWTNGAGGLWNSAGNWSAGTPGPGNTALFQIGSTFLVDMFGAGNPTISGLTVGSVSSFGTHVTLLTTGGATTITMNNFNLSGINSGNSMTLNSGLITLNTNFLSLSREATLSIQGGADVFTGTGTIFIANGGTSGTSTLSVSGSGSTLLSTTAGPATNLNLGLSTTGFLNITNSGFVDLGAGGSSSSVGNGGTGSAGTILVDTGGTLQLDSLQLGSVGTNNALGTFHLQGAGSTVSQSAGSTLNIGRTTGTGLSGILNVHGGTFQTGTGAITINSRGQFNLNGGVFDANGGMTVTGEVNQTGGTLNFGSGKTVLVQSGGTWSQTGGTMTHSGLTMTISGAGSEFSNTGWTLNAGDTVNVNSGGSLVNNGTVFVNSGAALNLNNGNLIQAGGLTVRGNLVGNAGSSFQLLGSQALNIQGGGSMNLAGTLTLEDGQSVNVSNTSSLFQTGNLNLQSGATLTLNGGTARSHFQFNGGAVAFNSGTLHHTGSLTADSAVVNAALGPTGTLHNLRTLIVDGTTTLEASLTLDGGRFSTGNLVNGELLTLNRGTLQISGSTLAIGSGGPIGSVVQIGAGLTIESTGGNATTIANDGRVIVAGGTLGSSGTLTNLGELQLTSNSSTVRGGTLQNNSMILGTGRIENNLQNNAAGVVQVVGGERLVFNGNSNSNSGHLDATGGGRLEFRQALTNQAGGLITGESATLRFDGGLVNHGSLGLSFGTSNVFGDLTNSASGILNVSGGGQVTFYEDVIQNGTFQIAQVGNSSSTAVVFGSFSGSGGFTGGGDLYALGDLRPGNSPDSVTFDGNLFLGTSTDTFIELGGLGSSDFDQLIVTGDFGLNGELWVSLINEHLLNPGETYLIGEVGGLLSGTFQGLTEGSLVGHFGGEDLFITYAAGDGNDIGLFTAVPEPAAWGAFTLLGCLAIRSTRFRRKSPA